MLAIPLYEGLLLHYTRAELEIDVTTASRMLAIPLIISRNCSPQRQLSPAEGTHSPVTGSKIAYRAPIRQPKIISGGG